MLHMVTSGPSPGPTSSPNTNPRHSTSHGLGNIVCLAAQQVPHHGLPKNPKFVTSLESEGQEFQLEQLLEAVGVQAVEVVPQ